MVLIDECSDKPLLLHDLIRECTQARPLERIVRHHAAITVIDHVVLLVDGAVVPVYVPALSLEGKRREQFVAGIAHAGGVGRADDLFAGLLDRVRYLELHAQRERQHLCWIGVLGEAGLAHQIALHREHPSGPVLGTAR